MEVELQDWFLSSEGNISVQIRQDSIVQLYNATRDKGVIRFRMKSGDIDTLKPVDVRLITDRQRYIAEKVMIIKDETCGCYRLSSESFIKE